MPKLYEYMGYTFLFYSDDHRPRHVHVQKGDQEMKVEIEDEHYNEKTEKGTFIVSFKRIKGCQVFNGREKRELSIFINTYRKDIIQKWDRVFVDNKAITPVKVNKRLKKQGFLTKLLGL